MSSPLITRVNHNLTMHTDDILISIACGIVFATLTIAFII